MDELRLITWLSPSIPAALYELIARDLGEQLGEVPGLTFQEAVSGPLEGDDEPFTRGDADVGFVCAPSFRFLNAGRRTVDLLPLPVPLDPRAGGRPVYFADVVVGAGSAAASFSDLHGLRWAFNDRNSKSGWFSMIERCAPAAAGEFFSDLIPSGSHLNSLALVRAGTADAAAIDSNVLRLAAATDLRVLESWGPFPIQPAIIRASMADARKERIAAALLTLHERHAAALATFGFARFVKGDERVYA